MKKTMTIFFTLILVFTLGAVVFADTFKSRAEIFASLKGITIDEAYEMKGNSSFGELSIEENFFEEFKAQNLEVRKSIIEEKIKSGLLSESEGEELLKAFQECDGTKQKMLGQKYNFKFGQDQGQGQGKGQGQGQRQGQGKNNKMGFGWQDNN